MTDNIFVGGQQYNECYLKKCIKPCRYNTKKVNPINPVLVRSTEALEKQEISKRIRNLEVKTMKTTIKLNEKLNQPLDTEFSQINCKKPMNTKLLQKSLAAMTYMNYSARISNLFKKVNKMAILTDSVDRINQIRINTRFQPGIKRYDLCKNMDILNQKLNLLNEIIDQI